MRQIVTIIIGAIATSCSAPESAKVTLDAAALIGKERSPVDAAMGSNPDCHEESGGTLCEYGGYNSAFFVNGKAANLTLPRVEDLGAYGLDLGEPATKKEGWEHWSAEVGGQKAEIDRFPEYVYIMTHNV
ncbi:hypothetical protein [Sphingomonas hankyongi]|uniref:Uncharacterized protein n=1 Tax=Sphingomonas hankyongi TaxID=2908209 RepID=A0ABT0S054_9SPHN|nr:hypothetical protein [Sphingomonas hankyongi]MCL6729177.1 hypothetical protein [Sphingomonas hankyongi]